MHKTRKAYGYHKETAQLFDLGDTVTQSLKANMMVKDFENKLIESNPQLEITFKIEPMTGGGEK